MKKRILSLLLAFVLCFSVIGTASARWVIDENGNIYEVDDTSPTPPPVIPSGPTYSVGNGSDSTEDGSWTCDRSNAKEGATVTITAQPKEGYEVGTVTVKDKNGKTITVTKTTDGKYTFVMPKGDVSVSVTFAPVAPVNPFVDVKEGDWFFEVVCTAAEKGWVNGTDATHFNPNSSMKRGDFAVLMANIKKVDLTNYKTSTFSDVPANKYYSKAIAYCADMGYLDGVGNNKFAPESTITREQMAKLVANVKGLTQVTTPQKPFADDGKISSWAKGYVYACAKAGIVLGDDKNNANPKTAAKRKDAAAMVVRAFA